MNILLLVFASVAGLLFVIASITPGYATASGNSSGTNNSYATLTVTSNMIAAGGPIPPNYTIAQQEAECAAATDNPAWFRTLMPAEHHDSARTELFPCSQDRIQALITSLLTLLQTHTTIHLPWQHEESMKCIFMVEETVTRHHIYCQHT
ncbi:MAG TPA: hypothetical protein VHJ59_08020 [Nitrososphaera sp.]|nr:hypothetical protein [Nitrososphaera sp.]